MTALNVFSGKLVKLSEKKLYVPNDYFFVDASRSQQGREVQQGLAVALALIGDSISASAALQRSNAEVLVRMFEFMVGERKFAGLLASLPFDDGDEVEVVASDEESERTRLCFAVARPRDRLIALRPHCNIGRTARRVRVVKRTLVISLIGACTALWMTRGSASLLEAFAWTSASLVGTGLIWAFIEWRIYVENLKPIVLLTERILASLGVEQPESADLIRLSKQTKTGQEPLGYRWQFYRY
jgi:hypothetical protein